MDFSQALATRDENTRLELIKEEVYQHDWGDEITASIEDIGWLEDSLPIHVQLVEATNLYINISVCVAFTESTPTQCKDANRTKHFTAWFRIEIERMTGGFEINLSEVGDSGEDQIESSSGDFY